MGEEVTIQTPVAIIISECRHNTRAFPVQSEIPGRFVKPSIAQIDIEKIGSVETADVKVEVPIIVDVDEADPATPIGARVDSGGGGLIFKLPIASIAV